MEINITPADTFLELDIPALQEQLIRELAQQPAMVFIPIQPEKQNNQHLLIRTEFIQQELECAFRRECEMKRYLILREEYIRSLEERTQSLESQVVQQQNRINYLENKVDDASHLLETISTCGDERLLVRNIKCEACLITCDALVYAKGQFVLSFDHAQHITKTFTTTLMIQCRHCRKEISKQLESDTVQYEYQERPKRLLCENVNSTK